MMTIKESTKEVLAWMKENPTATTRQAADQFNLTYYQAKHIIDHYEVPHGHDPRCHHMERKERDHANGIFNVSLRENWLC